MKTFTQNSRFIDPKMPDQKCGEALITNVASYLEFGCLKHSW